MQLADWAAPLPFQRRIVDYLRAREPALWEWFSSDRFRAEHAAAVRLELLKSSYRLDRAEHGGLHALADEAARGIGLTAPITLYQAQSPGGALNASLCFLPGEAHVLLTGPVTTTLTPDEQRAVLAHELAHHVLWEKDGGALQVASEVLSAMAADAHAEPAHAASARLFHLYLELSADRASLAAGALEIAVAALVKVQTGLATASGERYLAQAAEILGAAPGLRTEERSHPEAFVRARALQLWSERGAAADVEVERLLEGAPPLGELDLLAQERLERTTRALVTRLLAPAWMRSATLLAHARAFFDDFAPAPPAPLSQPEGAHASVLDYLAYVLLDFAAADPALEDAPLAAALLLEAELGLGDRLRALAAKELKLKKKELDRVQREATAIVARADGEAPEARG